MLQSLGESNGVTHLLFGCCSTSPHEMGDYLQTDAPSPFFKDFDGSYPDVYIGGYQTDDLGVMDSMLLLVIILLGVYALLIPELIIYLLKGKFPWKEEDM